MHVDGSTRLPHMLAKRYPLVFRPLSAWLSEVSVSPTWKHAPLKSRSSSEVLISCRPHKCWLCFIAGTPAVRRVAAAAQAAQDKKQKLMWEALREATDEEMEKDPTVCVIGARIVDGPLW